MIRWGILGCGKIAHKFAEDLIKTEGAQLHAVGSRSLAKAKAFAQNYQAAHALDSYQELAHHPELDIIYIATPHMFHKAHSILCMGAGKSVLCEKAFAMNLQEVDQMLAFAKAYNDKNPDQTIFLMEALWTQFLPHFNFVLTQQKSGDLGAITGLEADFGFKADYDPNGRLFNKSLGGGSLYDVGIYPLFAALSFLGMPESLNATAEIGPTGVDHHCHMTLHYKDGVKAKLHSALDQHTPTTATLYFEHGQMELVSRFHEPSGVRITKGETTEVFEFPTTYNGYHYEIVHCHQMLAQKRTESTQMTWQKSRQLMQLLDQVRQEIGLSYH